MTEPAKVSRAALVERSLAASVARVNIPVYAYHPLADMFPMMDGAARDDLRADIAQHGQREPIWLYAGDREPGEAPRILDGRNRYECCVELGVLPQTRHYRGADLVGFVVSLNLRRRHLDESQRAIIAARLATFSDGRPSKETPQICGVSAIRAAGLLNVSPRSVELARHVVRDGAPELVRAVEQGRASVYAAADIASLAPAEQAGIVARGVKEILAKAKEIRAEKAVVRRAERFQKINAAVAANAPLPTTKKYPIVYADPPWKFEAGDSDRATENHYPTMGMDEIAALPIGAIAADDALLFLWVRASLAFDPRLVPMIEAWGFRVVSHLIWAKPSIGTGFWARERHEPLLICKRGDFPAPALGQAVASVIEAPRRAASEKPDAFYDVIEAYSPGCARIELFARLTPQGKSARPGWDVWGNESGAGS